MRAVSGHSPIAVSGHIGGMRKNYGVARLEEQANNWFREMLDQIIDGAKGDSAIEKLLFVALNTRVWLGATEFTTICRVDTEENERQILTYFTARNHWSNQDTPSGPVGATHLIIRPQAQIGTRRVDFLIHALDWRDLEKVAWRRLIIECDGHDYHERTKEQAKLDRSKDRAAILDGYEFFRFTGSEIWGDPWGCAEQITDWAILGWGFK